MASASFLEQAASSMSLSVTALVSVFTLAAIVITFGVYRLLFPSTTKSKSRSGSSKQHTGKDKKPKETNAKKQPTEEAPSNKKKAKKNAVAVPSSATSQSEESEEEKTVVAQPTKKAAPAAAAANKSSAGKKATPADVDAKAAKATNDSKASSAKQQAAPARADNPSGTQSTDAKKKQTKAAEAPAPAKPQQQQQQPAGKNNASNKVNVVAAPPAKKAVAATTSVESKPVESVEEVAFEHEDEGPWVTQGGKQVNNRSRNKGKNESARAAPTTAAAAANANNHQQSPRAPPKRKGGAAAASKVDSDGETSGAASFDQPTPPPAPLEPIEVCQLLPSGENRYTSSDNWWKQPLNQQPTFSVTDIGDWPERDQDEQYVVDKKRFMPVKKPTTNGKAALTEKDINVDAHAQGDEKVNFDEQTVAGESNGGSASQSKKKSTNVRRIS